MKAQRIIGAVGVLLAGTTAATGASAAIDIHFDGGLATPAAGYTIVDTFDDATGLTGTNFQIKVPPADGNGAPPANSIPSGTPYLSVLAGGSATYTFATPVSSFQFDWGSIDAYNTLTINGTSQAIVVPGSNFINPANGDQGADATNGRFTVTGTEGELFTSVTFSSTGNSFEVDNLAVRSAVPEPATWAMMLLGFGSLGVAIRRKPKPAMRIRYA
ncbi:PEP-CTERM sorting domain-containing protein [Sphingomonas panacisoli]|uniref:PEP-CTERM sorting domain-containing protein n=1 Tax=Sphingomonas panacisoli TaxID=1813879 RepID=A0A5B8LI66_9SPHN|nr:PEPxxWA-CTERM sorting domain-containing protein [Sphingomonas panacisoli]QDZ08007.1 PEP-CTERM sorting domain-containing protein [Sphingomonas panacisoli]